MVQLQYPRTLVGIAFIWGILWGALAMIVGTIIAVIDPAQIDPGEAPIALAPVIGLVGFICGLAFAFLASIPRRGERIFDLPLTSVVLWGIVIAALVPVLTGKIIPEVLVMAPLGAVSATVSIEIMRRWAAPQSAA